MKSRHLIRRWAPRFVLAVVVGVVVTLIALNLSRGARDERALIDHVHAPSDAQFVRTMHATFASGIVPGNRLETLVNGDEIFPAMLDAIRGARETISFETYIYWDGMIAEEFAAALAERAQAGVETRVLIDWVGSIPMEERIIEKMTTAGVRFERFRPLRWYDLDRVNNRTHRKLLVVDGRFGFTGGVGIADKWLGDARGPHEWRENHYRIEGPVVAQMQAAFAENWLRTAGEALQGDLYYPPLDAVGEAHAQMVRSSPAGGGQDMHRMLMMAIASASSHIRIGMAYFVPDDHAIAHLAAARQRGVEIDILVPGEHTDAEPVRRASRHFWGTLLRLGARIHEYEPTMYHPKIVIIDDEWATIGSTNFDERSFSHNDEANLNVYDPDFVREQIAIFDEDLTRARQITLEEWENRPLRLRLSDSFWSWWRPQF